jgi:putrescine transport system permease protein
VAGIGTRFRGRTLVALIPYAWLAAFFLVPFLIVFRISLSDDVLAQPPYAPLFDWSAGWAGVSDFIAALDFENYAFVLSDTLYLHAYLQSVWIAALSTAILALVGFPLAYAMARAPLSWRPILLMLVVLPFWTSFLIRVYAWMGARSWRRCRYHRRAPPPSGFVFRDECGRRRGFRRFRET